MPEGGISLMSTGPTITSLYANYAIHPVLERMARLQEGCPSIAGPRLKSPTPLWGHNTISNEALGDTK